MDNIILITIIILSVIILLTLILQNFGNKERYVDDEPLPGQRPNPRPSSPRSSVRNLTPIHRIRELLNDLLNIEANGGVVTLQDAMVPLNLISEHRYHNSFNELVGPPREEIFNLLSEISRLVSRSVNTFRG